VSFAQSRNDGLHRRDLRWRQVGFVIRTKSRNANRVLVVDRIDITLTLSPRHIDVAFSTLAGETAFTSPDMR
jgi:hypothetical protein